MRKKCYDLDWFIALFVSAVIGGSSYFAICFTTQLKAALSLCNRQCIKLLTLLATIRSLRNRSD